jgi:hypothetical protein
MSESVSVGGRWRSCSADQSANDIHRGFARRQIPKTLVLRGGRDARVVPNAFVTSCSRWAVTSKSSRIRRFSRSRPPSAGASASFACACANVRFFFPLLDARSSSTSSSTSTRRCPWTAAYSSSSASPASRRNGEPKAGLGARGGGDVVQLLVDELVDPDLELPVPTVIRPLCRRDIRFLFCFSSDSSISTWIVATIGAWRRGEGRMRGVPARGVAKQTT